ncbi:ABC transporter substrate-binding protein [Methanoculleus sp. 7T]|uniref:ABC transporter substrate-binding protein n=1 Tax=Methanoculleus sp. 7T TaxID=2937282 RepID=UPI0020C08CF7|nr:cobalamin-binding protein [Methanoculleus sp. 7T]MCK8517992.1 cobalamin-binding protein [Methanoculleus sp. 7T]
MRNTRLAFSASLIVVLLLLSGTASATPVIPGEPHPNVPSATGADERCVTVTDDFGETVTIRGIPQRIVSLAPSNTEILYALDLGDRVVGVTDCCDYPPTASDKPKVGGYSGVNIEKVIAAEPDLVFAAPGNTEDTVKRLRTLGMTVVVLNPRTVDDVLQDVELVGEATGQEEQASVCVKELRNRIRAVTEKTEGLAEKPSVAHVVWYDPIWVSGRGTFQDEVIAMAGGTNAFGSVEEWSIVSLEEFITTDPEYIFVSSGTGMSKDGYNAVYDYFMNEPRMQRLDAVRNGHIYIINADIISRGGPRIVDALEEAAGDLYPDLFGTGAPKATPAVQSPGFGAIPLTCALFIVFMTRVKR